MFVAVLKVDLLPAPLDPFALPPLLLYFTPLLSLRSSHQANPPRA